MEYKDFFSPKTLEKLNKKSAENLINGIEKSKTIPFERVLYALGIRYVGETVAKKLAKHYKSIDAIAQASIMDLILVDEIGDKIAQSVVQFFENQSTDTGLIYGNATYIDTNNKVLYNAYDKGGKFYGLERNGFTWAWNMQRFFICPQSTMFRSEMVKKLGGYNAALFYEDFDFFEYKVT
jgi:hypothetical protein